MFYSSVIFNNGKNGIPVRQTQPVTISQSKDGNPIKTMMGTFNSHQSTTKETINMKKSLKEIRILARNKMKVDMDKRSQRYQDNIENSQSLVSHFSEYPLYNRQTFVVKAKGG
jgi:hypothetical protein